MTDTKITVEPIMVVDSTYDNNHKCNECSKWAQYNARCPYGYTFGDLRKPKPNESETFILPIK